MFLCHNLIFNIHFHKSSDIFIISITAMTRPPHTHCPSITQLIIFET